MPGPADLDDPDDRAQVAREGRERLGDRLLVADVGEDVAPDRQPAARCGGNVEAGLVHQAEQAERSQGHGLAARVGTGHDQGGVAVAQPDVDRDDAAGEARVTGREQRHLGPIDGLGTHRAHLGRQGRLGGPQVEARQRVRGCRGGPWHWPRRTPTARRGSGRPPRRSATCASRQALPSSTTTSGSMNSVCAAPGRVVDDALDPRPGLGLDRDHVAPVAQGDDRLLEGAPELRPDERVEATAQAVVGDPDGGPEATRAAARRCRAAPRPDRSCGSASSAAPAAGGDPGRGRAAAAGARRRASWRGARSHRACRRSRGTGLARGARHAPPARPPARCRAHRRCRPRAAPRAGRASGRSRRAPGPRCTGSLDGSSASASRRDGGNEVASASRARTPGNSSRTIDRSSIGDAQRVPAGPETDGCPARLRRHGMRSSTAPRHSRSRSAAWRRIAAARARRRPGRVRGAAGMPGRTGPCRSSDVSSPNAAATRPGPLARRMIGDAREPRGVGGGPLRRRRPAVCARRERSGRRASARSLRAARRHGRAARPANRRARSPR